jgi:hypothetical protein
MVRTKVFVSYSRAETDVRDEVLRALRVVPRINNILWQDEGEIAIGFVHIERIPIAEGNSMITARKFCVDDTYRKETTACQEHLPATSHSSPEVHSASVSTKG